MIPLALVHESQLSVEYQLHDHAIKIHYSNIYKMDRSVLLIDQKFRVGRSGNGQVIRIENTNREIYVRARSKRVADEWVDHLKLIAQNQAIEFRLAHERMSYAPVRRQIRAAPLIDGSAYMSTVADAMETAREEIYIADWWLSPTLFMKRPYSYNNYWRLDKILKRKAQEGIRIFVLLYNDVNMALHLNSEEVLMELMKLHEGIKVIATITLLIWLLDVPILHIYIRVYVICTSRCVWVALYIKNVWLCWL